MSLKTELLAKMRKTAEGLTLAQVVEGYELTNTKTGSEIPDVRGVLMDILEARDPEAFNRWMDTTDPLLIELPSRFFNV